MAAITTNSLWGIFWDTLYEVINYVNTLVFPNKGKPLFKKGLSLTVLVLMLVKLPLISKISKILTAKTNRNVEICSNYKKTEKMPVTSQEKLVVDSA